MTTWNDPDRRRVFVDTSAYFGLTDRRSSDFQHAQDVVRRLATQRRILVTTNFVIAETHALLLNRLNRRVAWDFLNSVERMGTTVVPVNSGDERRAREIIALYDDKDFTLTDAASFAVMERLRIVEAFTFDHHFAQFGFRLIDE